MLSFLSLGPLLALDNIVVAFALAPLCRDRAQLMRLIAWFAAVEALAPVVGALLHPALPAGLEDGSAALVLTLGLALFGLALARRTLSFAALQAEQLARGGVATAALAIVLGLDNLLAGASEPLPLAAACGAVSAGAVIAACAAGRALGLGLTARARALAGGALLVLAGAMALT